MQELETEKTYSWFERFLFYTLPVLFTLLLTGVLLTVFGYNVLDETLRVANKIPGISKIVPDPLPSETELKEAIQQAKVGEDAGAQSDEEKADTQNASSEAAAKDDQIKQLASENTKKDGQIADLTAKVDELQAQLDKLALSDEEYTDSVRKLADVYANMTPSKAAPVIESLTPTERVLVLSLMKQNQQVAILEKMDPQTAAETSIRLKDVAPAKDAQIAALQERLKRSDSAQAASPEQLTESEVSRTFAQMDPDKAAAVLLAMSEANLNKVVNIIRLMDAAPRASVLNALTDLSKEQAAKITVKLG
jgi:flagellar motility protein MotE (MotC chaperone)